MLTNGVDNSVSKLIEPVGIVNPPRKRLLVAIMIEIAWWKRFCCAPDDFQSASKYI